MIRGIQSNSAKDAKNKKIWKFISGKDLKKDLFSFAPFAPWR
jgi:hypothetical protein